MTDYASERTPFWATTCLTCGAYIADSEAHTRWHDTLDETTAPVAGLAAWAEQVQP